MAKGKKRIAVIGAGPCGLAAVKYLLDEEFEAVDVYEQRDTVGGVWNYTSETLSSLPELPMINPGRDEDCISVEGSNSSDSSKGSRKHVFLSPMYDRLASNIPKAHMKFTNFVDMSPETQLFPKLKDIKEYIERYAADIRHFIKFNCRVENLAKDGGNSQWKLSYKELNSVSETPLYELYDAVVVCVGHYAVPFIPPVDGLQEFENAYPGSIQHSKYYRNPQIYTGKKVIVVGNGSSGIDASTQIIETTQLPVIQSCRKESPSMKHLIKNGEIIERPPIKRFKAENRTVEFEDGQVETNVNHILFCTGYLYSLPFLKGLGEDSKTTTSSVANNQEPDDDRLITTGLRTRRLYEHMFYIPDPTLSFLGLPVRIAPFPISDLQAVVVAGVLSGRLKLPLEPEMRTWEETRLSERGSGKGFHTMPFPEDCAYMKLLEKWNNENPNSRGRLKPTSWGPSDVLVRENSPALKVKTLRINMEGGKPPMSYKDLGFDEVNGFSDIEDLPVRIPATLQAPV